MFQLYLKRIILQSEIKTLRKHFSQTFTYTIKKREINHLLWKRFRNRHFPLTRSVFAKQTRSKMKKERFAPYVCGTAIVLFSCATEVMKSYLDSVYGEQNNLDFCIGWVHISNNHTPYSPVRISGGRDMLTNHLFRFLLSFAKTIHTLFGINHALLKGKISNKDLKCRHFLKREYGVNFVLNAGLKWLT